MKIGVNDIKGITLDTSLCRKTLYKNINANTPRNEVKVKGSQNPGLIVPDKSMNLQKNPENKIMTEIIEVVRLIKKKALYSSISFVSDLIAIFKNEFANDVKKAKNIHDILLLQQKGK